MRVAITGGTGFVGRHLARSLDAAGHEVVLIARGTDRRNPELLDMANSTFVPASITDREQLQQAFTGCDAVVHCAGINREVGEQNFQRVHVDGTASVIDAMHQAEVRRILFVSYLHARPGTPSAYHETKYTAEQLVRKSGLNYTILKLGMIYGQGDHMLAHIRKVLRYLPLFATVGLRERTVRPVSIEDVVRLMATALENGRLNDRTIAVVGPEALPLSQVVRRVAKAIGKPVLVLPLPVTIHSVIAWSAERFMKSPLVTRAQVRMLAEGISDPLPDSEPAPPDLSPRYMLTDEQIRRGLAER